MARILVRLATRTLPYGRPHLDVGFTMARSLATVVTAGYVIAVLAIGAVPDALPDIVAVAGVATLIAAPGLLVTVPVTASTWAHHATPDSTPRRGAVLGGVATTCSLFAGTLPVGFVAGLWAIPVFAAPDSVWVFVYYGATGAAGLTIASLVIAGWIVVPVGAYAGWSYQRSWRDRALEPERQRAVE